MLKRRIVLLALLSALALAGIGARGIMSFQTPLAGPIIPPVAPPPY